MRNSAEWTNSFGKFVENVSFVPSGLLLVLVVHALPTNEFVGYERAVPAGTLTFQPVIPRPDLSAEESLTPNQKQSQRDKRKGEARLALTSSSLHVRPAPGIAN